MSSSRPWATVVRRERTKDEFKYQKDDERGVISRTERCHGFKGNSGGEMEFGARRVRYPFEFGALTSLLANGSVTLYNVGAHRHKGP